MQMMKVVFQVTISFSNLWPFLFFFSKWLFALRFFRVDVLVFVSTDLTNVLDSMRSCFLPCRGRLVSTMELIFQILWVLKKVIVCHIVGCRILRVVSIGGVEHLLLGQNQKISKC